MRILIADDEAPLRSWLKRLLAELAPDAQIVGEAGNGAEALAMIRATRPDVAFLDIRMPELSGLEVAAQAGDLCRVVFVTAYDEFAVQAFEQAAADYLVKPVTSGRLEKTLQRLAQSAAPSTDGAAMMRLLLERLDAGRPRSESLRWLRVGSEDSVRLIDVREVDYFKAADKYTEVHQGDFVALIRNSLSDLERDLSTDDFWRINRGLVVRVQAIKEARRDLMGRLWVHLHSGGQALPVSRANAYLFSRN